jgi:hypothetical protein
VTSVVFFVIPAVVLGFRLSFATEAVVLSEPHMAGAFRRSFRFTEGRFERWLEMIALSAFIGLVGIFIAVAASLAAGFRTSGTLVAVTQLTIAAVTPVIQYAWTFFYLRLVEIEPGAPGTEVGPAYAAQAPEAATSTETTLSHPPVLALVEGARDDAPPHDDGREG